MHTLLKAKIFMTNFSELGLTEALLRAVTSEGYTVPTPIQAEAIPLLLQGRDMLGIAQTGTGKTAAFALPILQRLTENKRHAMPKSARALILTPTRELALQIKDGFKTYGRYLNLKHTVIFGGVSQRSQVGSIRGGTDVLVATPGRLLDLMNQRHVDLRSVEVFVLDEADRMLDMGFIRDVRTIAAQMPTRRQTLFFSATMPDAVGGLAKNLLKDFARVEVTPQATTVEGIVQRVMLVARGDKRKLLAEVLSDDTVSRALVFTRTKHCANRVAEQLKKTGVAADAIHGNKSQSARQQSLAAFKSGKVRVLVATDIAARGIDVDNISHVINFELPTEPESYVHRIGRTARAGSEGIALSFCDASERGQLKAIERTIRQSIPVDVTHAYHGKVAMSVGKAGNDAPRGKQHSRRNSGRPWVLKPRAA
jgi:ATP-dependent RNA helicase RhlE